MIHSSGGTRPLLPRGLLLWCVCCSAPPAPSAVASLRFFSPSPTSLHSFIHALDRIVSPSRLDCPPAKFASFAPRTAGKRHAKGLSRSTGMAAGLAVLGAWCLLRDAWSIQRGACRCRCRCRRELRPGHQICTSRTSGPLIGLSPSSKGPHDDPPAEPFVLFSPPSSRCSGSIQVSEQGTPFLTLGRVPGRPHQLKHIQYNASGCAASRIRGWPCFWP